MLKKSDSDKLAINITYSARDGRIKTKTVGYAGGQDHDALKETADSIKSDRLGGVSNEE